MKWGPFLPRIYPVDDKGGIGIDTGWGVWALLAIIIIRSF